MHFYYSNYNPLLHDVFVQPYKLVYNFLPSNKAQYYASLIKIQTKKYNGTCTEKYAFTIKHLHSVHYPHTMTLVISC
jgi:hypothetical protein